MLLESLFLNHKELKLITTQIPNRSNKMFKTIYEGFGHSLMD